MNLVVIYGPPAAGKLTVARELAKLTGYKVLHNHLVIDMVESVFDRSNKMFWELIDLYRLDLVDMAAQHGTAGMILTSVNIKGKDDKFIRALVETMSKNSGKSYFVQLRCSVPELKRRLESESRKTHGKLMDAKIFDDFVEKNQVFEPIGFVESLSIDNTDVSAEKTAAMIKERYGL